MSLPRESSVPPDGWLAGLRKVQYLLDLAAAKAVRSMAAERGGGPACGPDCPHCCRGEIPVSSVEAGAALLHLLERTPGSHRLRVLDHLRSPPGPACPFLVAGRCAVYPDRFLACRQFHVFGRACLEGEDPWALRPRDIPRPDPALRNQAVDLLADLYGEPPEPRDNAWRTRFLQRVSPPHFRWDLRDPAAFLKRLNLLGPSGVLP